MTHPDLQTLRAYARGHLSPTVAKEIDTHARTCRACREALQASVEPQALRRVLARIEREGGHVAFEELSAMADGKLAAQRRSIVEGHLRVCGRCRREWTDLRQFAPVLARPVRARAAPSEGWLAGLGRWFGSTGGMRAVGAAVVVAAATALVVSSRLGPDGGPPSPSSARFGGGATEPPVIAPANPPTGAPTIVIPSSTDHNVFERLDRIAPEAVAAYRAGDFATVAKLLKPRADRGDPAAAHALGLLYAEGRGVPKDLVRAKTLLKQATAKGDADAAADLAKLPGPIGDSGPR